MPLLISGFLCATAGFLIIVASVVFVVKGKAVLSDTGAPNVVEWGKLKANLTSALALFVLGAAMVVLPFWSFQRSQDEHQNMTDQSTADHQKWIDSQPVLAHLTQEITESTLKNLRLLVVEKPDYDQNYGGQLTMDVPLVPTKHNYSIIYVQNNEILYEQFFSVSNLVPGTTPQATLPALQIQLGKPRAQTVSAQEITPQLDISNEDIKKALAAR